MKYLLLFIPLIISYLLIIFGVSQEFILPENTKFLYPFPLLLFAIGSFILYISSQASDRKRFKVYAMGGILRLFLSICYFGVYVFLEGEKQNIVVLGAFGFFFVLFKVFEIIIQRFLEKKA